MSPIRSDAQVQIDQGRHATVRDLWDTEDWESTREEIPRLRAVERTLEDTSWTAPHALADVHQMLTRPTPALNDELEPAFRPNGRVISQMLESEAVQQMRDFTIGDPLTAGLATTRMGEKLAELFAELSDVQEQADEAQKRSDEYGKACDGAGVEPGSPEAQADDVLEAIRQAAEAAMADLDAALDDVAPVITTAARQAAEAGAKETGDLAAACAGWGIEKGEFTSGDATARLALAERLTTPRMIRMAELVGRLRTELYALASPEWTVGHDEVADITHGDDLEHVLADELVYLAVPGLEPLFYEKYVGKKLMQLQLRGRRKEAKGKIIYCEDASSSMQTSLGGQASIFARALAIVLLDVAIAQQRGFVGIVWSGQGTMQEFDFGDDASTCTMEDRLAYAEFVMTGDTWPMQALQRSLAHLVDEHERTGRTSADVVMATDGVWKVPEPWAEKWDEQRAELGFRCYGIAMNTLVIDGLERISDHAVEGPSLVSGQDVANIFRSVAEPSHEYA